MYMHVRTRNIIELNGVTFRFGDIVPSIRINCVKYSRDFLLYHPHLVVEIAGLLIYKALLPYHAMILTSTITYVHVHVAVTDT